MQANYVKIKYHLKAECARRNGNLKGGLRAKLEKIIHQKDERDIQAAESLVEKSALLRRFAGFLYFSAKKAG